MSPLEGWRYFSTVATGLAGKLQTCWARRKTPCITTSSLFLVRGERGLSELRQASIDVEVIDSRARSPNAGNRCASRLDR
jgi:hypothetical protein